MKTDEEWMEIGDIVKAKLGDGPIGAAVLTQIGTDGRTRFIDERKAGKKYDSGTQDNGDEATEKQINFAKKLGIEKPETHSKQELSKLIDEKKKEA